jgi:NitT/TauT family transport system substrate-binding protein
MKKNLVRSMLLAFAAVSLIAIGTTRLSAQTLKVGVVGTTSDAIFFIAENNGYFKDEGLSVEFIRFDSAAKMIAPLGSGELDVGGGATSSALYNAVKREVNIRIVADKGRTSRGNAFEALLVRRDLYDGGKVRALSDLKGLKIAVNSNGNSEAVILNEALKKGGLTQNDIDPVYLGFPQMPPAFQNKALDGAVSAEPFITYMINEGTASKLVGVDEFLPDFQNAVTLYGGTFIKDKPAAAKSFARALVRAIRFYNDALKDGRLAGPTSESVIATLVQFATLKDAATYRSIISHGVDPDGVPNVESLRQSWQYFKDTKQIDSSVTVDDVIDLTFVKAAVADLGPYHKAQ